MLTPAWPSKAAYVDRIFGSHDFSIEADVVDLNERVIASVTLLDGQVDLQDRSNPIRRTADLLLSDPEGALDFSKSSAYSGTSIWIDRMVRIRHIINVGGQDVSVVPFIGPPASISRSGAEVSVKCRDKSALASRGCPPMTVKKGMYAVEAIRALLVQRTGEFRFRFAGSTRRLSKDYSVGWADSASVLAVAQKIARAELGWQFGYYADGYAMLRPYPTTPGLTIPGVTEQAVSEVDFTEVNNHVRVTGKATTKKVGKQTIKTQPFATATLKSSSSLSPTGLARKGVPIYLPLVITDDAYTKTSQVRDRAVHELEASDRLETSTTFSCVPVFHLDVSDLVTVKVDYGTATVRLETASIPLGISGDMTIGSHRPLTKQPKHKSRVHQYRWKKYTTGPKGHKKTHWRPIK